MKHISQAGEQIHVGSVWSLILLAAGLIGLLPANALSEEQLPTEAYEWHIVKGIVAGQDNDWPTAEAHFLQALAVLPVDQEATVGLGIALAQQGKNEEALTLLDPAKQIWPDDPTLWGELEALYRLMGRTEGEAEAAATVKQLLPSVTPHKQEEDINFPQPAPKKPWWGRTLAALEHNTNSFLIPDDPSPFSPLMQNRAIPVWLSL